MDYVRQNFVDGQILNAAQMNHIEDGIINNQNYISKQSIPRINVADMIDEELSSSNIVNAINLALQKSSNIFIPDGDYKFHMTISQPCSIELSKNCRISSDRVGSCIDFINNTSNYFSIELFGGQVYYGDGTATDYPTSSQSQALIQFSNIEDVYIHDIYTPYCDYTCVIQFTDCVNILCEKIYLNQLVFSGLHCVNSDESNGEKKHTKSYIVRNCKFTNVKIPTRSGVFYSYGSYTGSQSLTNSFTPPQYVLYENNYCENCQDSSLDSHGANVMRAIGNTCINCNTSITLYDDSRRVKRKSGFKTDLIELHSNWISSEYYNGRGEHPAVLIASSGDMQGRISVRDNYIVNNVNGAGDIGIDIARTENVVIENNYIETTNKKYPLRVTCCNFAQISNNNIQRGTSNYRISLRFVFAQIEGPERASNVSYGSYSGAIGSGTAVGVYSPLVCGQQIYSASTASTQYVMANGIMRNPTTSSAESIVDVVVEDGFVYASQDETYACLPKGTRFGMSSDGSTYSWGASETVATKVDRTNSSSPVTVFGFKIRNADISKFPNGNYKLKIENAAVKTFSVT